VRNKKADILQIRKYLNGELNAPAMHKLEQEALDDPFLMDALEGYEANGKDQQVNLNLLTERLHQRTAGKKGRIIPWKVWSIAASVVIILAIGGLWLKKTPPTEKTASVVPADNTKVELKKDTLQAPAPAAITKAPLVAGNEIAVKETTTVKLAEKPVAKPADKKSVYQQEISAADASMPAPAPETNVAAGYSAPPAKVQEDKKDNTQQLSEVVVMNYTSKTKQDSMENLAANSIKTRSSAKANTAMVQAKVSGVTAIPASQSGVQYDANRIAGVIISKNDGSPVIGAAIRVRGTNKSTVTDTRGYFALPVAADNQTLDIASIGYERKQISAKRGDSVKVELNEISGALYEVVTTNNKPASQNAHPQTGWDDFKKYLQNTPTLPDGTEGTVNVIFTVGIDGTLTDFKIKKSLNATADQKAIDIIKAGSAWVANTNGKPETVNVKVKFQKQ
jgi:TonB family protein